MFVSKKASFRRVLLEGENIVLGPTSIGDGSILGRGVILGYPCRSSLKQKLDWSKGKDFDLNTYDSISAGVKLGNNSTIRPGTVIYEGVSAGTNLDTGHNVLIRENTTIGDRVQVGSSTIIDGKVVIGSRVSVQSRVYLPPMTSIGDDVFLAPCVTVTNDRYPESRKLIGVTVKRGAVIGANAVLVAGITVGEEAVVAAGAIVTRSVAPGSVVIGIPARQKMTVEEYRRKKQDYERI